MPNMGFRGIYAGANSNFGGRITGGDILPARRGNFYPIPDFAYLNPIEDYYKNNTFLLKAVGSNTQQNYTFLDSSPSNLNITRNGDVNQGSFSPYSFQNGAWSALLDGSGDFTVTADNAALEVGTSNFTLECWFYINGNNPTNGACILAKSNTSSFGPYSIAFAPSGALAAKCSTSGSIWEIDLTSAISFSNIRYTWNHVALVRSGSTFTLYFNGVSVATATNSGSLVNNAESFRVGNINFANTDFPGYISNVRLVVGTAVYTSAFTPPTTPLTAISGTALLTCQSNRFVDNSTNSLVVSGSGNVKVSAFSPFNPTSVYSAGVNGGSMYFDGTGDYLTAAYNTTNHDWWASDYTIECWIYPTTLTGWTFNTGVETPTLVGNMDNASATDYWSFGPLGNGTVRFYYYNGTPQSVTTTATVSINQWNHIAMTKTSSGITVFVNGVASSTTAVVGTPQSSASVPLTVGRANATAINGYVSNLRIVKGTAVYSGNFTPPTSPLTAITNTTYLLSGTNAGIIDTSRKNNLYTFGNAQVSTNVFKYDKSLYLDGTGDYVLIPTAFVDDLFQFGTGDFTVETWVRFVALGSNRAFIDNWVSGQAASWQFYFSNSNQKLIWYVGSTAVLTSTTTPTTNTWYHLAVARSGTTIRLFVDGNLEATTTSHSLNYNYKAPLALGVQYSTLTNYLNGYMEDTRITKGYARYTANFTPAPIIS